MFVRPSPKSHCAPEIVDRPRSEDADLSSRGRPSVRSLASLLGEDLALLRRVSVFALAALLGCSAVRPPAVSDDPDDLARAPLPGAPTAAPAAAPAVAALPTAKEAPAPAPPSTEAPAPSPNAAPAALPALNLGPVGSVTTSPDERPLDDGPELQAKAKLLWQAIVDDTPDVAASFFFPKEAYVHVKAAKNPEGDWRWRLWKHFERDIHALHKSQGQALAKATFKGLRIPPKRPHWAAPGNEYNRLGYWRAYGSQLTYELRGRERHVPISSLISWKSQWYVVHMTGFR